jgi:protein PsiE
MQIPSSERDGPDTASRLPERPIAEATRRMSMVTGNLHREMKDAADAVGSFLVDAFHLLALFAIGATTVWSAAAVFIGIAAQGHASR